MGRFRHYPSSLPQKPRKPLHRRRILQRIRSNDAIETIRINKKITIILTPKKGTFTENQARFYIVELILALKQIHIQYGGIG